MKLDTDMERDEALLEANRVALVNAKAVVHKLSIKRARITYRLKHRVVREYPLSFKNKSAQTYIDNLKEYNRVYRIKQKDKKKNIP